MVKVKLFIILIFIGIVSCNINNGKNPGESVPIGDSGASCKSKSLNPNGDSELAILMREMAAITDSLKSDMEHHREIRSMPENLSTILTAKKTDETIDKNIFTPLAQDYLDRVKDFYAAPINDARAEKYNDMVRACVGCHENFCGGPIKRIKKLYILTL